MHFIVSVTMNFASGPRKKMCSVCRGVIEVMEEKSECERFTSESIFYCVFYTYSFMEIIIQKELGY